MLQSILEPTFLVLKAPVLSAFGAFGSGFRVGVCGCRDAVESF